MKLTAEAERSDKWWAVEVPEIEGLFTQARRLDQVPAMVKDAAALLTGQPEDSFEVVIQVHVHNPSLQALIREALAQGAAAARMQAEASEKTRKAARCLAQDEGLTVREIGEVLGVSHQRAHQLIAARM